MEGSGYSGGVKKLLPLVGLLALIALGARSQDQGLHLELPDRPWSEVRRATFWESTAVTRRQDDIRKILAFFEDHRDHWEPGLPREFPHSYVCFSAANANANFGLTRVASDEYLCCEGMRLRLTAAEFRELTRLLVDRRPPKDPFEDLYTLHCPSPYQKAPPLAIMVWQLNDR